MSEREREDIYGDAGVAGGDEARAEGRGRSGGLSEGKSSGESAGELAGDGTQGSVIDTRYDPPPPDEKN